MGLGRNAGMSIMENAAESWRRFADAIRLMLALLPFSLWLGAHRHGTGGAVYIHIDEWGRITRLRRPGRG
jgi:hypothetical protein